MPRANIPCISIEGAMISKRNFSGEERKFNPAGRRNFLVAFHDMDMVDRLIEDGWRIKKYEPREEGDEPYAVMQVAVSFDYYPPNICLIKGKRKIKITEETVSQLDYVEIANADLVIRPYQWTTESGSGIKAYVKTLYITVPEDDFDGKYSDYDMVGDDNPF